MRQQRCVVQTGLSLEAALPHAAMFYLAGRGHRHLQINRLRTHCLRRSSHFRPGDAAGGTSPRPIRCLLKRRSPKRRRLETACLWGVGRVAIRAEPIRESLKKLAAKQGGQPSGL